MRRHLNGGWSPTALATPPNHTVDPVTHIAQIPGGALPTWDVVPGPGGPPTPTAPKRSWVKVLLVVLGVLALLALVGVLAWKAFQNNGGGDPRRPDPIADAGGPNPADAGLATPLPTPGPTPWIPGTPPPTGWALVTTTVRIPASSMQAPSPAEGPELSAGAGTYWCAVGAVDCSELVVAPADGGGGIFCRLGPGCIVRR